ncbi:MAG TPA: hypothetical protein VH951_14265 [Dehalococcoidia bacterium]
MSDQDRAQTTGKLLIAGAALQMLLFLYGTARRSYLALALPVTAAMTAVTILTLWLGWTMLSMQPEEDEAPPVTPIAPQE